MLSPDPFVQAPEYSQNFNRYSYVMNNPLNMTDPTGFFFSWVSKQFNKVGNWLKKNWRTVVAIVFTVALFFVLGPGAFGFTGMGLQGAQLGLAVGALSGGFNAAINGGSASDILRGAMIGGISGAISGGVLHGMGEAASQAGLWSMETLQHVAGHGLLGGASNVAMGGKFQDGFIAAAAGAAAGNAKLLGNPNATGPGAVASRTIRAGIIGGTATVLGGGKFANGAWTASFQHLLNAELDWSKWSETHFTSKDGKMRIDSNVYGSNEEGLRSWKIQMHIGAQHEEFIFDPATNQFRNAAGQQIPKQYRNLLRSNPAIMKGVSSAIDRVNSAGANIMRASAVMALLAPLGLANVSNPNSDLRIALTAYQNDVNRRNISGATFSAAAVVQYSGITSDSIKVNLYEHLIQAVP
jgi:hypothetical protein